MVVLQRTHATGGSQGATQASLAANWPSRWFGTGWRPLPSEGDAFRGVFSAGPLEIALGFRFAAHSPERVECALTHGPFSCCTWSAWLDGDVLRESVDLRAPWWFGGGLLERFVSSRWLPPATGLDA